jgi:ABC-type transporter Mla MlaB component
MFDNTTLCLHIPVTISLGQRELEGELSLPAGARELRLCIGRESDRVEQRREARRCAKHDVAALNLQSVEKMTSGDLLKLIDWVRSRRLLQEMSISLVTPPSEARAALKAAHHRPASVTNVFVLSPQQLPKNQPVRLRHLTLAYSA